MMAPPPMDPAMMAPPAPDPSQELMATEQMADAGGEGIGALFADQVATALESAEEPKEVIDAIRGNDMPLESRYQELADYVGEEDALATPPSVLTMVQPTIMMTEEGAVNSGIGDLMQNITEGVEMETAEGEATPMAEGVGSLMMGVEQPLTQNFRQGGPVVQRFNNGGEGISNYNSSLYNVNKPEVNIPARIGAADAGELEQYYRSVAPFFENLMGTDEARKTAKSRLLFDIAGRGLAFAGGVSPEGVPLTGSPAQKLAQTVATLPATTSAIAAQAEQDKKALKMAALNRAMQIQDQNLAQKIEERQASQNRAAQLDLIAYQADITLDRDAYLAANQAQRDELARNHQSLLQEEQAELEKDLVNVKGAQEIKVQKALEEVKKRLDDHRTNNLLKQLDVKLSTEMEIALLQVSSAEDIAYAKIDSAEMLARKGREIDRARLALQERQVEIDEKYKNDSNAIKSRGVDVQEKLAEIDEKYKNDSIKVEKAKNKINVLGNSITGRAISILNDEDARTGYATGGLDATATGLYESAAITYVRPETETVANEDGTGFTVREKAGKELPVNVMEALKARLKAGYPMPDTLKFIVDPESVIPKATDPEATDPEATDPKATDLKAIGSETDQLSLTGEVADKAFGFTAGLADSLNNLTSLVGVLPANVRDKAIQDVKSLNEKIVARFKAASPGKDAQQAIDDFRKLLPVPGKFDSLERAMNQYAALIKYFDVQNESARKLLNSSPSASAAEEYKQNIISAEKAVTDLQVLVDMLQKRVDKIPKKTLDPDNQDQFKRFMRRD
jgi:hypothetical protein